MLPRLRDRPLTVGAVSGNRLSWADAVALVSISSAMASAPEQGMGAYPGGGVAGNLACRQLLGVVDEGGGLPDPALSLLDGLAQAGVEAVTVQVALARVVAAHQAGPSHLRVKGLQHPEASGAL